MRADATGPEIEDLRTFPALAESVGAAEFPVRWPDGPLSPVAHLLHRLADGPRVRSPGAALSATSADQGRRQQGRLGRLVAG